MSWQVPAPLLDHSIQSTPTCVVQSRSHVSVEYLTQNDRYGIEPALIDPKVSRRRYIRKVHLERCAFGKTVRDVLAEIVPEASRKQGPIATGSAHHAR